MRRGIIFQPDKGFIVCHLGRPYPDIFKPVLTTSKSQIDIQQFGIEPFKLLQRIMLYFLIDPMHWLLRDTMSRIQAFHVGSNEAR